MGISEYDLKGKSKRNEGAEQERIKLSGFDANLDLFGAPSGFVCTAHRCQSFFNFSKFRDSSHFVSDGTFGFGFPRSLFATV